VKPGEMEYNVQENGHFQGTKQSGIDGGSCCEQ